MKNSVYTLSINKIFSQKDTSLNISFLSVFGGLSSGTLIYICLNDNFRDSICRLFVDFYSVFTDKSSIEIFSGIVFYGIIYFISMFIIGGSIFGKTMAHIITFFKVLGITVLACSFYTEYSIKGLQYALLVFFPGKCTLLVAMLLMTKICFETSRDILSFEKSEKSQLIQTYIIKSSVTFLLFLLSWIIDFICIILFSDLFDFT